MIGAYDGCQPGNSFSGRLLIASMAPLPQKPFREFMEIILSDSIIEHQLLFIYGFGGIILALQDGRFYDPDSIIVSLHFAHAFLLKVAAYYERDDSLRYS